MRNDWATRIKSLQRSPITLYRSAEFRKGEKPKPKRSSGYKEKKGEMGIRKHEGGTTKNGAHIRK